MLSWEVRPSIPDRQRRSKRGGRGPGSLHRTDFLPGWRRRLAQVPPPSTNGDAPPGSETGPTGTLRADCPGAVPHSPPQGTVPARPPIPPAGAVKVDGSSHRAGKLFGEGPSLAPNLLLRLCRGGSGLQPWAGGPAVALPGGLGAAQFRYWCRPRQGISVNCITGPALFSSKTMTWLRPWSNQAPGR